MNRSQGNTCETTSSILVKGLDLELDGTQRKVGQDLQVLAQMVEIMVDLDQKSIWPSRDAQAVLHVLNQNAKARQLAGRTFTEHQSKRFEFKAGGRRFDVAVEPEHILFLIGLNSGEENLEDVGELDVIEDHI